MYKNSTEFGATIHGSGILAFKMQAGTYTWKARSSSGSQTNHWTFMEATGTMTFASNTDVMLLVPNHGGGTYGAGGGLFFIQGLPANLSSLSETKSETNAILVIGGGGSGTYENYVNPEGSVGPFTNDIRVANIRRTTPGRLYWDDGAGFLKTTVYSISTQYGGEVYKGSRAYNFVEGGAGGTYYINQGCGGLGGGSGYPGGGGGYTGGIRGSTGPPGYGGGGGTSYYNPQYIKSPPTIITPSVLSSDERSTTVLNPNHAGYFEFTLI